MRHEAAIGARLQIAVKLFNDARDALPRARIWIGRHGKRLRGKVCARTWGRCFTSNA